MGAQQRCHLSCIRASSLPSPAPAVSLDLSGAAGAFAAHRFVWAGHFAPGIFYNGSMTVLNVLATSHGTDSAAGREAIALIREQVRSLLDQRTDGVEYRVHEAYVDVESPSVDDAAAALPKDEPCVIVPILLSTGFHTQVDLRRAARASGIERIVIAESLGPDSRLARLARTRLEEVGWTPENGSVVVQGAAGSSRADGRADMERAAELLSEALGTQAQHGFIASIDPKFHEVVAEYKPEFAATYLLAEGFFAGKMRRDAEATGLPVKVAAPLVNAQDPASARVVAECFVDRMDEALAA